MNTPAPAKKIHLALAAVMTDMEAIAKNQENKAQGFKFRGIEDVYNELHPLFRAHGITCLPFTKKMDSVTAGTNAKGNPIYRTTVEMGYRFIASDGSSEEASMFGEGMDFADKSCAKALSVAHKYLLLQTFLIPTAEVVDGDYYSPTVDVRAEIERRKEEEAKRTVLAGGDIQLPEADAKALEAKRAEAAASNTVVGTPVETVVTPVHTETLPPETKPKRAPKQKPVPQEAQSADSNLQDGLKNAPSPARAADHPASIPSEEPDLSWQGIICHIGKAGGTVLGKTLGELFTPTRAEKNVIGLVEYFRTNVGTLTAPSEKDAALWDGVRAAEKQWRAWQKTPASTPEPSNGTNAAASTGNAATDPATLKRWQDFVIESRNEKYHGRPLEDMSAEELSNLEEYRKTIDMSRATPYQKAFTAAMALAMQALNGK